MPRKRKNYWIKVDNNFIKGWRKLDLCETKDEAHMWKSEKSVNKYRDIVSEKYLDNEVLVDNDSEVNIKPEVIEKPVVEEVETPIIEEPVVEVEVEEVEKGTEIEPVEEVKTFKEYLSDDKELNDDDFNFDIE